MVETTYAKPKAADAVPAIQAMRMNQPAIVNTFQLNALKAAIPL